MKPANPKPRPKPPPQQASSSSSSAADPNPKGTRPTAADPNPKGTRPTAAADSTPTNPNPNGVPNPAPLIASPHPHLPPPLPPPRPLLTVAAVEAAMASIPPPPTYGLESLDRRTVALSDGTVRSYFVLPLEPPPQLRQPLPLPLPPPLPPVPARHLGPPGPVLGADRWPPPPAPAPAPAPALLGPAPKRKWEDHQANGGAPGESSGRQQLLLQQQKPEERRVAKQVKVEMPEVDEKMLKSSFLKMVKLINNSTEEKKNYRANGKISQLKCAVCGRDSIDLHALLNHSYNAKNAELRADHLGLHKALCVLMGWNYSVDPVHRKAYQTLSTADAEANQGDLILWPPTIIIENTYKSTNDGQKDGMSNKEMEGKLREMGFAGVSVEPLFGKDGQRAMLVKFAGSLAGLNEALRLAEFFETGGHGRAGRARARSIAATADGASNPMLVKVNEKGERTWVLYGYLATAWDLDVLDTESKQNAVIKSRKELDSSD